MKRAAWIVLIYGVIVLIGGIMGHLKAMSTISLIVGGLSGIFLILTAIGMFKNSLLSAYLAVLITLILDAFFTYRFLLTFRFFPSGFMVILSLAVLIIAISLIRNQLKKERRP